MFYERYDIDRLGVPLSDWFIYSNRLGTGEKLMHGIDPYAYMQQVAGKLDSLTSRTEVETVLDELEYLFEVVDPELQDSANALIEQLRKKLAQLS